MKNIIRSYHPSGYLWETIRNLVAIHNRTALLKKYSLIDVSCQYQNNFFYIFFSIYPQVNGKQSYFLVPI